VYLSHSLESPLPVPSPLSPASKSTKNNYGNHLFEAISSYSPHRYYYSQRIFGHHLRTSTSTHGRVSWFSFRHSYSSQKLVADTFHLSNLAKQTSTATAAPTAPTAPTAVTALTAAIAWIATTSPTLRIALTATIVITAATVLLA
jgi:hypothetical protein